MPYTDTSSAPCFQETFTPRVDKLVIVGTPPAIYSRVVTTRTKSIAPLTQAAADSAAVVHSNAGESAISERMNEAGWHRLRVTTETATAYVLET